MQDRIYLHLGLQAVFKTVDTLGPAGAQQGADQTCCKAKSLPSFVFIRIKVMARLVPWVGDNSVFEFSSGHPEVPCSSAIGGITDPLPYPTRSLYLAIKKIVYDFIVEEEEKCTVHTFWQKGPT